MTVLSAQTIRARNLLDPCREHYEEGGVSGGLGPCGYDLALDLGKTSIGNNVKDRMIRPGDFVLAASVEQFIMPDDLVGIVHDKSSWARQGLAVQNTIIEPGWRGFLTLELTNHGAWPLMLQRGMSIAQVVFHLLDEPTQQPYQGKYQDQAAGPQLARFR